MKTIKAMKETDINVEGSMIVVSQTNNYRTETVEIPIAMWSFFCALVEGEIDNPTTVEVTE